MRLIDALDALAPDAVPIVDGDGAVDAAALREATASWAGGVRAAGVPRGALVAVALPASSAYVGAVAGIQAAGAVPVGINARLPAAVREALAARLRPAAWVGEGAPGGVQVLDEGTPHELAHDEAASSGGATLVVCSSGTTAVPRAYAFASAALAATHAAEIADDPHGPGVMLGAMPPGNLFMATRLASVLVRGGRVVLLPRWDPAEALHAVREHGVDTVPGVPAHFADLLAQPDRGERLRRCVIGGDAAPGGLVRAVRERFGCEVVLRYSATHTGAIASSGPVEGDGAPLRPLPGVEIAVEDGRVLVRSPMAPLGEWDGAPSTAWIDTGDLGVLHPDGTLTLRGRADDAFTRGGTQIVPAEIEAVLAGAPGVREAIVIGEEDARLGMRAIAFVAGDTAPGDVAAFVRARLPGYLVPDEIRALDAIPRTPAGKPDRRALRDR